MWCYFYGTLVIINSLNVYMKLMCCSTWNHSIKIKNRSTFYEFCLLRLGLLLRAPWIHCPALEVVLRFLVLIPFAHSGGFIWNMKKTICLIDISKFHKKFANVIFCKWMLYVCSYLNFSEHLIYLEIIFSLNLIVDVMSPFCEKLPNPRKINCFVFRSLKMWYQIR